MAKTAGTFGQINDPPRSSFLGSGIILLVVAAFTLSMVVPGLLPGRWLLYATLVLLPMAVAGRSLYAIHISLLVLFFYLANLLPHFRVYPFSELSCLIPYAYTVAMIPALRKSVGWTRIGNLGAKLWGALLAIVVVATVALVLWVHFLSPNLSRYLLILPKAPWPVVLGFGIAFSAFNALLEETIWRGVMLEALDSALGAGWITLLIQAASFGLAHYQNGFPNGIVGAAMAGAYGIMLGVVRRKSRGMLGCWLAHVLADSTIFALVLLFAHHAAK